MGKDKGTRHVALAIVYSPTTRRVLMVTSRKHPHLWILPKGGVDKGEASGAAAVREASEEAGTPPTVAAPAEDKRLTMLALEPASSGRRGQVWHVYALQVEDGDLCQDWLEKDQRKRQWFTLQEAMQKIHQWYKDGRAEGPVGTQGNVVAGTAGSKAQKGAAMETAFAAFAERIGWDP